MPYDPVVNADAVRFGNKICPRDLANYIASAARTASVTGGTVIRPVDAIGLMLFINLTANAMAPGDTVEPRIRYWHPGSDGFVDWHTGIQKMDDTDPTGAKARVVGPFASDGGFDGAVDFKRIVIPHIFQLRMVHTGTASVTYSVDIGWYFSG